MDKNFYRVGCYNENNIVLDSKIYNYGNSFTNEYDYLIEGYFKVANQIDLPIDFLIFINNGIALNGSDFLDTIRSAIVNENYVDLFNLTGNINHKDFVIPISLLNEFIRSIDKGDSIRIFAEGKYLWESFFELVRQKVFNELPSRKKSIFLFDNIDDCKYYINSHNKGFAKIYEVEIVEKDVIFQADMNIFDEIDLSITYNNLILELFKYWDGQLSEKPRVEYLFQGKCRIKNVLGQHICHIIDK